MKKLLFLIIFLFPLLAIADGEGYQVQFTLETSTGEYHNGFVEMEDFEIDKDSINKPGYAITLLTQRFTDINYNFTYYKQRIAYNYYNTIDEPFYYLIDKSVIPSDSIKSIQIENIFNSDLLTSIKNEISLKDTVWMSQEPLDRISTNNSHCVFSILVHEKSKALNKLLKQIGEINILEEESPLDKKHAQLMEKLNAFKVIVIESCAY